MVAISNQAPIKGPEYVFSNFAPVMRSNLSLKDKLVYGASTSASVLGGAIGGDFYSRAANFVLFALPRIAVLTNLIPEFSIDGPNIRGWKNLVNRGAYFYGFLQVAGKINQKCIHRFGSKQLQDFLAPQKKPQAPPTLRGKVSLFSRAAGSLCAVLVLRVYHTCLYVLGNTATGKRFRTQVNNLITRHWNQVTLKEVEALKKESTPQTKPYSTGRVIAIFAATTLALACLYSFQNSVSFDLSKSTELSTRVLSKIEVPHQIMPKSFASLRACVEWHQTPKSFLDAQGVLHCEFFDRYASTLPRVEYDKDAASIFRKLAGQLHQDKGGSAAASAIFNSAHNMIKEFTQNAEGIAARRAAECVASLGQLKESSFNERSIDWAKRVIQCGKNWFPGFNALTLTGQASLLAEQVQKVKPALADKVVVAHDILANACGWVEPINY